VDLDVMPGEHVAIMGSSGSGKSTLLNLLGCLDRPSEGSYFLGGEDVSLLDDDALSRVRGERLGFIFQSYNLIPQLTVLENIEVPLFYQGKDGPAALARCKELAHLVGLDGRLKHRPKQLSGGQQQRVAIARALVNRPPLILADEPTGNLDSRAGTEIMTLFRELNAEGITLVMVTHEPDIAAYARRTIHMRDGVIQ
jgi:putative ABC transport system ATP-binding protein